MSTCQHCGREIVEVHHGRWVDPYATGDDAVWWETCDANNTFTAEHEPTPEQALSGVDGPTSAEALSAGRVVCQNSLIPGSSRRPTSAPALSAADMAARAWSLTRDRIW